MFPTPVASEGTKAPSQQTSEEKSKTGQVWLSNIAKDLEPTLLPTPLVDDAKNSGENRVRRATLASEVWASHDTNWGKFEPAIRRWEEVLGRPAPAPTKPDGKDGAHRLSSSFTEFMMGLEPGWITDVGLTRNEELKACGNGVVPQQAELALRILLEGTAFPPNRDVATLPTPTVVQGRNATSGRKPDSQHHHGVTLHDLVFDGTLPKAGGV